MVDYVFALGELNVLKRLARALDACQGFLLPLLFAKRRWFQWSGINWRVLGVSINKQTWNTGLECKASQRVQPEVRVGCVIHKLRERNREYEADAFACERTIKLGVLPVAGITGSAIFSAFEYGVNESDSDDPATLRRMTIMVDKSIEYVASHGEALTAQGIDVSRLTLQLNGINSGIDQGMSEQGLN